MFLLVYTRRERVKDESVEIVMFVLTRLIRLYSVGSQTIQLREQTIALLM